MIWVKSAEYLDNYRIKISFNNFKEGIIDLKIVICNDKRKIFQELKDINKFKQFTLNLDLDTIIWNNGLDLAPEFLYDLYQKQNK